MKLRRVIVNADDLGATRAINDTIFGLMDARRVTSATIMANGPAFQDAVAQAKSRTCCSFGVHLNLTAFQPLTHSAALAHLTDREGRFCQGLRRLGLLGLRPTIRDAVYSELAEQIRAVAAAGLDISHLDSHHHVHTVPPFFFILKRLQRDFGIRRVRIARNEPYRSLGWRKRVRKGVWNQFPRRCYRTATTQGFCNLAEFYETASSGRLHYQWYEVATHPGAASHVQETDLLRSRWKDGLPYKIQLINYWDI